MKLSSKTFIFFSAVVCSALFAGLSIPLINGKVPPNAFYGIRIPIAMESEVLWYKVNHIGGKALLYAAVFMLLSNLLLFIFRKKVKASYYAGIFLTLVLATVFLATLITHHHASQL